MNPLKKAMVAIILCIGSIHAQETETKDTLSVDTKYLDEVVVLDSRLPLKRSQSGKTIVRIDQEQIERYNGCLLYTSPSPRDLSTSRMPSSA